MTKKKSVPVVGRTKRERLEAAGWKFGTVQEFLGLSDEDMNIIEKRRTPPPNTP